MRQTIVEYEVFGGDPNAFVCITDWANGEGFDVELNEKGCTSLFQQTLNQWFALKKAMKAHMKES